MEKGKLNNMLTTIISSIPVFQTPTNLSNKKNDLLLEVNALQKENADLRKKIEEKTKSYTFYDNNETINNDAFILQLGNMIRKTNVPVTQKEKVNILNFAKTKYDSIKQKIIKNERQMYNLQTKKKCFVSFCGFKLLLCNVFLFIAIHLFVKLVNEFQHIFSLRKGTANMVEDCNSSNLSHVCVDMKNCFNDKTNSYRCKFKIIDENKKEHYIYESQNSREQCNTRMKQLKTVKVWFDKDNRLIYPTYSYQKLRTLLLYNIFFIVMILALVYY